VNLRVKTVVITLISVGLMATLLHLLARSLLLGSYLDLERRQVERVLQRTVLVLEEEGGVLSGAATDYAAWDDFYRAMGDRAAGFSSLITPSTFTSYRIDAILAVDGGGAARFASAWDEDLRDMVPLAAGMASLLRGDGTIPPGPRVQLLSLDGVPVLAARHPVLTTEGKGPPRGYLAMARILDAPEMQRLSRLLNASLSILPRAGGPREPGGGGLALGIPGHLAVPGDETTMTGYAPFPKSLEGGGWRVAVAMPRETYQQGLAALRLTMGAIAVAGLVVGAAFLLLMETAVLGPLRRLAVQMGEVRAVGDLSRRLQVRGRDELGDLADSVNAMLDRLETAERHLLEQERLAAVGDLSAGIAHEFNNIMAGILSNTELALRTEKPSPGVTRVLEETSRLGWRAADLVTKLRDFSHISASHPAPVDLVSLARQWSLGWNSAHSPAHGLDLDLPGDGAPLTIRGEAGPLEVVLTNLADNARDALPAGGRITLRLFRLESPPPRGPRPASPASVRWVGLSVADGGTGMTDEVRAHLFEPFFTTKGPSRGTGLGMAQVFGIVKRHDARISVESSPGKGTTVSILFPALPPS
jgi:signal transduction histidine kinase